MNSQVQFLNSVLELRKKMRGAVRRTLIKFDSERIILEKKVVKDIMFNSRSKKVSIFKEFLIFDDSRETRYYIKNEIKVKLTALTKFYELNARYYPNYSLLTAVRYIYKNIKKKQRLLNNLPKPKNKPRINSKEGPDDNRHLTDQTTQSKKKNMTNINFINTEDLKSILKESQDYPKEETQPKSVEDHFNCDDSIASVEALIDRFDPKKKLVKPDFQLGYYIKTTTEGKEENLKSNTILKNSINYDYMNTTKKISFKIDDSVTNKNQKISFENKSFKNSLMQSLKSLKSDKNLNKIVKSKETNSLMKSISVEAMEAMMMSQRNTNNMTSNRKTLQSTITSRNGKNSDLKIFSKLKQIPTLRESQSSLMMVLRGYSASKSTLSSRLKCDPLSRNRKTFSNFEIFPLTKIVHNEKRKQSPNVNKESYHQYWQEENFHFKTTTLTLNNGIHKKNLSFNNNLLIYKKRIQNQISASRETLSKDLKLRNLKDFLSINKKTAFSLKVKKIEIKPKLKPKSQQKTANNITSIRPIKTSKKKLKIV